ncbi:hypothetical protein [Burkholderia gladioli]|uniref:hypothetical protein n=1 Tax=Burkholderia gladioli TaxID=28095 RepID=UPI001641732A|nr:hypothetical protein [Burkholderia gladioli]
MEIQAGNYLVRTAMPLANETRIIGVGKAQARILVTRQFMQESGGAFHAAPMPGPDRAVDGPVISSLVARFDRNP